MIHGTETLRSGDYNIMQYEYVTGLLLRFGLLIFKQPFDNKVSSIIYFRCMESGCNQDSDRLAKVIY